MAALRMRRGMALFMVLIIAILLLIVALALWQATQSDSATIPNQVRRMQAEYLAKGGLQMALLKARLMYTPLYHASQFSVGQNPFYPHTVGYDDLTGGAISGDERAFGPAFLTGVVNFPAGEQIERLDVKSIPGAPSNRSAEDWDDDGELDYIVDQHLIFFTLDVADRTWEHTITLSDGTEFELTGQQNVSIDEEEDCPMFGGPDPYSGRVRIRAMRVMGGQQGLLYREDALLIVAEAEVTATIAGVTETWTQEERTIYRATRRYDIQAPPDPDPDPDP